MISLVRGSADPLARSQETTSCRIRTGSGATVVDRIPNEFIESSLCDRSIMKPSSSVLLSLLLLLFVYLHASRSMNSNLQKKRERRREREREKLRGEFHSMNGGAHRGTSVWNRSTGKMDDIEAR